MKIEIGKFGIRARAEKVAANVRKNHKKEYIYPKADPLYSSVMVQILMENWRG